MKKIYKYKLDPSNTVYTLPECCEILSVGTQRDNIYIWALVETDNKKVDRIIKVFPTGVTILYEDNMKFIGTVFIDWMVFHVFEIL